MTKQFAFFLDSSLCSGCKTCQMACKDKHNLDVGLLWRRVYEVSGGGWKREGTLWISNVFAYHLSIACNHCEQPICLKSCPNKAIIKREDGIVFIDEEKCMGCRYCEWGCPYSSPRYNRATGIMSKCHFCYDLIDQGKSPACVSACPMRALDFGDLDVLRKRYGKTNSVPPLPHPSLTGPAIVIKPHRDAIRAGKEGARIINREEVGA